MSTKEDQLDIITGDLVGQTRWQPVLRELFTRPAGQWCVAAELSPQLAEAYGEEARKLLHYLRIAWLIDPYGDASSKYTVILFFVDAAAVDVFWERAALFNRASLRMPPNSSEAASS